MSDAWFHLLNLAGVAFFAISGALAAYEKDVDSFGVVVLGSITAVGGGTLRDLVLDEDVFWVANSDYLYACYLAIIVTIVLLRLRSNLKGYYLMLVDAIGLGLFNIIGIEKALISGADMLVAITLGTCTAIFGGLIRDVICREIPLVMRCELYATASLIGGGVYAILFHFNAEYEWCIAGSLLTTLVLRLGALKWGWRIPIFPADMEQKQEQQKGSY